MKWTLKLVAEGVPGKPTEYEVATIERIEKFSPATVVQILFSLTSRD
jgi:hypothetical protein